MPARRIVRQGDAVQEPPCGEGGTKAHRRVGRPVDGAGSVPPGGTPRSRTSAGRGRWTRPNCPNLSRQVIAQILAHGFARPLLPGLPSPTIWDGPAATLSAHELIAKNTATRPTARKDTRATTTFGRLVSSAYIGDCSKPTNAAMQKASTVPRPIPLSVLGLKACRRHPRCARGGASLAFRDNSPVSPTAVSMPRSGCGHVDGRPTRLPHPTRLPVNMASRTPDVASKWRQDRTIPRSRRKSGPLAASAAQAAPQREGSSTRCRTPALRNSAPRHRPRRRLRRRPTPPGPPRGDTVNGLFPPAAGYAGRAAD